MLQVNHLAALKGHELELNDFPYLHLKPFGLIQNWSNIFRQELLAEHMLAKENIILNIQRPLEF